MKRLMITTSLSCLICLVASGALAAGGGVRGGLTVDPDQVHVGAHLDMGPVLPNLRLTPNVELGFGDDVTLVAFNGDLIHDVVGTAFYVGGELGVNFTSWDAPAGADDSQTDIGLSALGGFKTALASGTGVFLEFKLGLVDSPDFKFTVGFDIF